MPGRLHAGPVFEQPLNSDIRYRGLGYFCLGAYMHPTIFRRDAPAEKRHQKQFVAVVAEIGRMAGWQLGGRARMSRVLAATSHRGC